MLTLDETIGSIEYDMRDNEQKSYEYYKEDGYWSMRALLHVQLSQNNKQLANWLRELQKWRALRDSINKLCDVDCEYPQYKESGTMCDACPIGTVKEYFEQIFDGEVNADEEGSDAE